MKKTTLFVLFFLIATMALGLFLWRRQKTSSSHQQQVKHRQMLRHMYPIIPRGPNTILSQIQSEIDSMTRENGLLYLASIYKRGMYPYFAPDPSFSDQILRSLVLSGDHVSKNTRSKALAMLYSPGVVCRDDIHDDAPPVPRDVGLSVQQRRIDPIVVTPDTPVLDLQNSHDHGVVSTARTTLAGLQGSDTTTTNVVSVIQQYISTAVDPLISNETKAMALHALESFTEHPSTQFDGLSEVQVLSRVWDHDKDKHDLVIHALANMLEDGQTICHTGKMVRLLDTVQPLLSLDYIRQDLQHEASRIRDNVLQNASEKEKKEYDSRETSPLQDVMRQQFDGYILFVLDKTGCSSSTIQPYSDEIKEAF